MIKAKAVCAVMLAALVAACGGGGNGQTFTVGGTISGLTGTVTLQTGSFSRSFSSNGGQTLSNPIPDGATYDLKVKTQPAGQICTITNGSGTVRANVTNVLVTCGSADRTYSKVSTFLSATGNPLSNAEGIAINAAGDMYLADMMSHRILKVSSAGVVSTFAGSGALGSANGNAADASFHYPLGVALDSAGNVYVADKGNHMIRKVTPEGVVSNLAGTTTSGSTDGSGSDARFNGPSGIAVDASGMIYVADGYNNMIRKITPQGVVTTLAGSTTAGSANGAGTGASFNFPRGIAVDGAGNVLVADTWNNMVRKITKEGVVSTLAGSTTAGKLNGTGTAATFSGPYGLALDAGGNLYVADSSNNLIRKIDPNGDVTTLAGTSESGKTDGPLDAATFRHAQGLAFDASGVLYVLESDDIRKID